MYRHATARMGTLEYMSKLGALVASFALTVGVTLGCSGAFDEEPEYEEADGLAEVGYVLGLLRAEFAPGLMAADEVDAYHLSLNAAMSAGVANGQYSHLAAVHDATLAELGDSLADKKTQFFAAASALGSTCGEDEPCRDEIVAEFKDLMAAGAAEKRAAAAAAQGVPPHELGRGGEVSGGRRHKADNSVPTAPSQSPEPSQGIIEWVVLIAIIAIVIIVFAELVWYALEKYVCPKAEEYINDQAEGTGVEGAWECFEMMFESQETEEIRLDRAGTAAIEGLGYQP